MKIILIDDHPLFSDGLTRVLKSFSPDNDILTGDSVRAGLALARQHSDADLVLLDLTLPDNEGLSGLTAFRRQFATLPVILLSATEDPRLIKAAIKAGAQGYIPKSSRPPVMHSAIELVMAGSVYVPPAALRSNTEPKSSSGCFALVPEPEKDNMVGDPLTDDSASREEESGFKFTPRQLLVLELIVKGRSNKEICRALNIANGTVKVHIATILRKLNASNRTQAGLKALKLGLVKD